jgi:transglutaminase-like putative cysteine protease
MIITGSHLLKCNYSRPVNLKSHFLRIYPQPLPGQKLLEFALEIDPQPTGSVLVRDLDGNWVHHFWYGAEIEKIRVQTHFKVQLEQSNPFDFQLASPALVQVAARLKNHPMQNYLSWSGSSEISELAYQILMRAHNCAQTYVQELCLFLYGQFHVENNKGALCQQPAHTLKNKSGTCSDLAWLMVDVCRAIGIPARIVSGYAISSDCSEYTEMHSWVECYIPYGGWKGYDPTTGLAVSNMHVAVSSCAHYHSSAVIEVLDSPEAMHFQKKQEIILETEADS